MTCLDSTTRATDDPRHVYGGSADAHDLESPQRAGKRADPFEHRRRFMASNSLAVRIAHPVFLDTRLARFNVTGSGERGCEDVGEAEEAEGLPKRWSARRKSEVVLRLLRGEDIGELSREIRVPAPELERWRRKFLEGACEGLKTKNAPDGELMRTRAKLGEMTMRVELQG